MSYSEQLFWEKYRSQLSDHSYSSIEFQKKFFQYSALIEENQNLYSMLKTLLKEIPLGIALRYWLNTWMDREKQQAITQHIVQLLDKKVMIVQDHHQHIIHLADLQEKGEQEYIRVIEAIRCTEDWEPTVQEELVKTFIDFIRHLNFNTFGMIPCATDPIDSYVTRKKISYSHFVKFCENLPKQEALIAKLLYFGGRTIESILSLKYGQLDIPQSTIHFEDYSVKYPTHILLQLSRWTGKKRKQDLIFENSKGNQVERNSLNQLFSKISKHFHFKIKPVDLLQ